MAVVSYELITVQGQFITCDVLVWRRYRRRVPGIVERLMDDNPHLAQCHRDGPFLPVGTQLRMPIDPALMSDRPQPEHSIVLYGRD